MHCQHCQCADRDPTSYPPPTLHQHESVLLPTHVGPVITDRNGRPIYNNGVIAGGFVEFDRAQLFIESQAAA
jgi:hypothetical protein